MLLFRNDQKLKFLFQVLMNTIHFSFKNFYLGCTDTLSVIPFKKVSKKYSQLCTAPLGEALNEYPYCQKEGKKCLLMYIKI